jgi:AsmA protein
MSRRVVLLIALLSLAILGAAAAPWTLTGGGLSMAVTEHLQQRYGLAASAGGRSTFALLPTPRVKFEDVTIAFPNETARVEGATLRGELRLLPLLFGRIELSEIRLSEARIMASHRKLHELDWSKLIKDRLENAPAYRLIVAGSSVRWSDLKDNSLEQVNLVIRWEGSGEPLLAVGSARWRGEKVSIEQASLHPDLLVSGELSPLSVTLSAPFGSIAVTGEARLGDDPRITGQSLIEATSLRDFTRWSGVGLPFGSLIQAASIKGDVSLDRRRLSWPSVIVTLGSDRLEGTMAVRLDAVRPLITGTLAADRLNLSDFVRPLIQARTNAGSWSEEAVDLARATGSDLDLRLSASAARIGRLALGDMAASILVRPGRIEASLGRADLHEGVLKGRLTLATLDGTAEFKTQGFFDGVDLAAFLGALGEPRWITGQAQGQFLFDGTGRTPAEMARQAQGRTSIKVTKGELVGVALAEALRRVEKRPLLASLRWKGGRTPFENAQAQLVMKNGIGDITEGQLSAPDLLTRFEGQISLPERTIELKADVSPANPAPNASAAILFNVSGGWDNVAVVPDARSLIERSGAAKPLFGPEPVVEESVPLASPQ